MSLKIEFFLFIVLIKKILFKIFVEKSVFTKTTEFKDELIYISMVFGCID